MSSSAKRKSKYDPSRQWGLKPEGSTSSGGSTYVVGGHVVSGSSADPRAMFIGESVGREAQAKAARKLAAKDGDKVLQRLLSRDKEGARALASAREFAKRKERPEKGGPKSSKGKDKARDDVGSMEQLQAHTDDAGEHKARKNVYSAELIKQLGFDPTSKDGKPSKDANVLNKVRSSLFCCDFVHDTCASVECARGIAEYSKN